MSRLRLAAALALSVFTISACWLRPGPSQGQIVLVPDSPAQSASGPGAAATPAGPPATGTATGLPATSTPVPTPFPTIAPEAAATAVSFYFQSANQPGGDPNFRLIIPALGLNSGITTLGWSTTTVDNKTVTNWDDPKDAVGFLVNSAVPGTPGNTVMIGHNNVYTALFKNLADLKKGDTIVVLLYGAQINYTVTETMIRRETGATAAYKAATLRYFDPTPETRLTLFTCWPENNNTHRVIVIAEPN